MKKYRVVFVGLVGGEDQFKIGMSHLGVSLSVSEMILKKAPVILKDGMTHSAAKCYAHAIQKAGGLVKLQGHVDKAQIKPLESFTMCPQCGYKQLKAETCVKCGFYISEVEKRTKLSR
jgi:ribosomal protein L32